MCISLQVAWMNFHVSGPSRGFRSLSPPQCQGMNMFLQHRFNHSLCMLYCYSLNRYSPFHLLGLIIECFSIKRPLKEGLHFPLLTQVWASVCRQWRHCFSMNWWDCGLRTEESEERVCVYDELVYFWLERELERSSPFPWHEPFQCPLKPCLSRGDVL